MPTLSVDRLLDWIPRLRRYARALVRRQEDADDLVQDTLERAWAKSAHWPQVVDMRAWLFTLMHHLHVDRARRPGLATVPWDESGAENVCGPAAPESGLQLLDLDQALAQLPPEQREILLLVALEDMSYADIARNLGIPPGTVMSRLSRGRERLRQLMGGARPAAHMRAVK